VISDAQSRQALAIACSVCGSPPGLRCTGLLGPIGHAARWHEYASRDKPEPDAACIAELTATPGRRADALPFVHWLDGRHSFRTAGRPGVDLTLVVYRGNEAMPGVYVRRALVDLAVRHGLVMPTGTGPRGTYAVTPRGVAFAKNLASTHQPAAVAAAGNADVIDHHFRSL